jgi:hypothetical protein
MGTKPLIWRLKNLKKLNDLIRFSPFLFGEIKMTSDNVHTPVRYPSDLSDEE